MGCHYKRMKRCSDFFLNISKSALKRILQCMLHSAVQYFKVAIKIIKIIIVVNVVVFWTTRRPTVFFKPCTIDPPPLLC